MYTYVYIYCIYSELICWRYIRYINSSDETNLNIYILLPKLDELKTASKQMKNPKQIKKTQSQAWIKDQ